MRGLVQVFDIINRGWLVPFIESLSTTTTGSGQLTPRCKFANLLSALRQIGSKLKRLEDPKKKKKESI